MGAFFEVSGTVRVHRCPAVDAIVNKFNTAAGSDLQLTILEEDTINPEMTMEVSGGGYMTFAAAADLTDILIELGPHAVEPVMLHSSCDGESDDFYVGPEDQQAAFESAIALDEIEGLLPELTLEDRKKLLEMVQQEIPVEG